MMNQSTLTYVQMGPNRPRTTAHALSSERGRMAREMMRGHRGRPWLLDAKHAAETL